FRVDGGHVTGTEPAIRKGRCGSGIVVVAADDPWPAHLHFAHSRAVPWNFTALIVHRAEIHSHYGQTLLGACVKALVFGSIVVIAFQRGDRADGRGFGHAPELPQLDAVLLFILFDKLARYRRACADGEPHTRHVEFFFLQDAIEADPDCRYTAHYRHSLALDELSQVARCVCPSWKDYLRTNHDRRERLAPSVSMKHRHNLQDDIPLAKRKRVRHGE